MDTKVFDSDLQPIFSSLGYNGIFNKKGGQVSEGVACFVNASKFNIVDTASYVIAEELPKNPLLSDYWNVVKRKENLTKRVLDRTTSCQLVVLESLVNGKRVVVANTHLYFHPDADHVRLLQAGCGLRFAHEMRERQQVISCLLKIQSLFSSIFLLARIRERSVSNILRRLQQLSGFRGSRAHVVAEDL